MGEREQGEKVRGLWHGEVVKERERTTKRDVEGAKGVIKGMVKQLR
jgi:hypothetical protein